MTNANQPQNYFAQDDKDAQTRFNNYYKKDPFPAIAPALLNSADIYDYVAATAMIHPFSYNPDDKKLKSASYGVPILGKLVYWDEEGNKQKRDIKKGDEFTLYKNSIAFVTLEPTFRLPDYIAMRFNLQITHVYRGILLGTGPLVDPGFTGRLSIPLHNLTNNDYIFKGGDDLIWIEFTKLSPNKRWKKRMIGSDSRQGDYRKFRNNPNSDVEDYLRKAIKSPLPWSIRSSIPEVFKNAEKAAEEATNKVKFFQNAISIGAVLSILTLSFSLWALWCQMHSLVEDSVYYVNTAQKDLNTVQTNINSFQSQLELIDKSQKEIEFLKKEIKFLKEKNESLEAKLSEISQLDEIKPP